jgi:uncharacterized protein
MTFTNTSVDVSELPQFSQISYEALDPRYPTIRATVTLITFIVLTTSFEVLAWLLNFPLHVLLIGTSGLVITTLLLVRFSWLSARARRFAIREHDVLFESGVFWRKQTIQPINRIQHVEVARGPIDKRYDLAKLQLFSSGSNSSTFVVPGLPIARAEQLREFVLSRR